MTKLLILVCLCQLRSFTGTLRVVYAEAEGYIPTQCEYERSRSDMEAIAPYPSRSVQALVRARCLSSTRMQGQPAALIAFTSFNEQLVRHMLGTISPHRLALINGRPPRTDYAWRERATQEIHAKQVTQYAADNPLDERGCLRRVASTFDYRETVDRIEEIYREYGTRERIICAATGSKMQAVGLFFAKVLHPDIHSEYPAPDSYYVKGISTGTRAVHEVVLPRFRQLVRRLSACRDDFADAEPDSPPQSRSLQ